MRCLPAALLSLALLIGTGCSDPFVEAQDADTIEAYEKFLAENPNSPRRIQAESRLEDLYLEKARQEKSLAGYDTYLEKFPKGKLREKAVEERRAFLFAWAEEVDTIDAWQQYLDEYKTGGEKKLRESARKRLRMAQNRERIELGPTETTQVNLAENPDGPLDGWGFYVPVTNKGDTPIEHLTLKVSYLDEGGKVLDADEWPAVAKSLPGNLPFEEGFDKPIAPGETRTWEWTTGDLPAGWAKKVKVAAVDIRLVGADAKEE